MSAAQPISGERLARLETQMEGVKTSLDRGSAGFDKFREDLAEHANETRRSIDELKSMVSATHAACIKHDDLHEIEGRVSSLETFRDRLKRYGGAVGIIGGGIAGGITLFGPSKIAAAFKQLWS
jgi:hypothetical protein